MAGIGGCTEVRLPRTGPPAVAECRERGRPQAEGNVIDHLDRFAALTENVAVLVQMLVNGVLLGGLYCLLGIGMTLIFGVMRIINACHGDLLMVAMYLAFFLFTAIKLDPFVAIFVAMPVLFVLGCAIYSGLIRRLRGEFAENSLILTWGVALVLANLFTVAFSGDYRSIVTSYSTKNLHPGRNLAQHPDALELRRGRSAIRRALPVFVALQPRPGHPGNSSEQDGGATDGHQC